MTPRVLSGLLMCAACVLTQAADLKGVLDPTRPPAGLAPVTGAASGVAHGSGALPAHAASAPAPLVLQAIRIDHQGGAGVAMINDQLLVEGERIQGYTVVSITAQEVLLKGPSGTRRMALVDELSKSGSLQAPAAKRGRKERS
jgi:hypothetical protein